MSSSEEDYDSSISDDELSNSGDNEEEEEDVGGDGDDDGETAVETSLSDDDIIDVDAELKGTTAIMPTSKKAIVNLLGSLTAWGISLSSPIAVPNAGAPLGTSSLSTGITQPTPLSTLTNMPMSTPVTPFGTPASPSFNYVIPTPPAATRSPKKEGGKTVPYTAEGLDQLTADDIKEFCRTKGIKNFSGKTKPILIKHVLTHPLHEPHSYKSHKGDIMITVIPAGSASASAPAQTSAAPSSLVQSPMLTNNIPIPTTSVNSIVAPSQFTPSFMFAEPIAQPAVTTTPQQVVAPTIKTYTSPVSPPIIPEAPQKSLRELLDTNPIPAMNEYRAAVATQTAASNPNLPVQEVANIANKSTNEQFLGVTYSTTPVTVPIQALVQNSAPVLTQAPVPLSIQTPVQAPVPVSLQGY